MDPAETVFAGNEASERLAQLGLEPEPLRDVVRKSFHAYISCSPNHPPLCRGIWAWGEAVRALREYALPRGMRRSDENNYSVVIDDKKEFAIAVATGDEATGIADLSPTTRALKGISTQLAVISNQFKLNLFPDEMPQLQSAQILYEKGTWILLIHRSRKEVRCELSLPSSITPEGRIDGWHERIILEAVPVDDDSIEVLVPEMPEIDVDVQRIA